MPLILDTGLSILNSLLHSIRDSASVDLLKEMPKDIFPPGFSSNIIIYDP